MTLAKAASSRSSQIEPTSNSVTLVKLLIHIQGRAAYRTLAYKDSGNPRYRLMRRHIIKHHATRPDLGSFTNFDTTENFRPGAYQHSRSYDWVAITSHLTRAAQSHLMEN